MTRRSSGFIPKNRLRFCCKAAGSAGQPTNLAFSRNPEPPALAGGVFTVYFLLSPKILMNLKVNFQGYS